MKSRAIIIIVLAIISGLFAYILIDTSIPTTNDFTEEQLLDFFRSHTVSGNYAAAIKLQYTQPRPGTAYLGTIHGYRNNLSVCEELIAPYNEDPSLTLIPGSTYYCELLR